MSERTPRTISRVTICVIARSHRGFAKGIKRTGPDIAVDDANAAERKRNEARRRVRSGARGGRRFTPAIVH